MTKEGQGERQHHGSHGHAQNSVDQGRDCHLGEQPFPVALLLYRVLMSLTEVVESTNPPLGQDMLQTVVAGYSGTDHVRSQERGDDRDCHDNRIEKVADHTERESK